MKWPQSLVVLVSSLVTAGVLTATGAGADEGIWAHLVTPREGDQVIGEIVLEAEVLTTDPLLDVVFFVDGRPIGQLMTEPYRMRYDLGDQNRSHTIEVVATDTNGRQARHRVTTTTVPIAREYEVDLQQLYVTVTGTGNGARVLDIQRDEFTIFDEGNRQQLVTFERGDVPFTAVMLIDSSASMYGSKIEAARSGATAFIQGMRELDRGKVMVFSDIIQNSTPFSSVPEVLSAGLIGATGHGGTAINDSLYTALKLLSRSQGRRLVVLLSDGIDTHSVLDGESLLDYARQSQAMVYWIRLLKADESADLDSGPKLVSAWRSPADFSRQASSLQKIVELSGGRIIPARSTDEIESVFVEILRELREQYALGYYPSVKRNDGSWHRIKVRVARPGVKVRTHEGYPDL